METEGFVCFACAGWSTSLLDLVSSPEMQNAIWNSVVVGVFSEQLHVGKGSVDERTLGPLCLPEMWPRVPGQCHRCRTSRLGQGREDRFSRRQRQGGFQRNGNVDLF